MEKSSPGARLLLLSFLLAALCLLIPAQLFAAPTGSIAINSNASQTTSPDVMLTLFVANSSGVTMSFSNDGSNWSTPEPFATSKNWRLLIGDGSRTVYVKYADATGETTYSSSITVVMPHFNQYADIVLDKSSQYGSSSYAATQVLGTPNVTSYVDNGSAWTPLLKNNSQPEWISVAFASRSTPTAR